MLKKLLIAVFLCITSVIYAQNVGINTTGAIPSTNAILDLNTGNAYNTGLIIPHVTLGASLSTFSPPILNAATVNDTGMIVYNMNGAQAVGYYCWNGSSWVSVSGSVANTWQMTGNSGTTMGTNYIGTNDSVGFEIKVNGKQRMMFNINHSCVSAGLGDLGKISTGHNNDAWGNFALANDNTGNYNSAVGGHAMYNNTSGWGNNAHGHEVLYNNTTGHSNSALGDSALYNNITGSNNTALGVLASYSNVTASSTTAVGDYAAYSNLSDRVTAIGDSALYNNTTGSNEAVGFGVLLNNTTGSHNTAIGTKALQANTTASGSTAIGHFAGYNTNADYGVFVGDSAGYNSTTSICGTFLGYAAGAANNGSYNTAVGYEALYKNTTLNNTALGYEALYATTSGSQNVATGGSALVSNTSGGSNTANGYRAMAGNVALSGNVAMGDSTLYSQAYASGFNSGNVAIGNSAMYANAPTSTSNGNQNTAVGEYSMRYNSTGSLNTAEGFSALYGTTTGNNNTALGYNALSANTAGSYNTAIGSGANVSFNGFTNATAIGAGATATASNTMVFGNSSVTQHEFTGALMPYYSGSYQAGTSGQALISQGSSAAPQWGAISVAGGGTGSSTFNPNALIFEGPTNTSPLTSSSNMTWNSNHNTLVIGTGTFQSFSSANFFGNVNSYYQLLLQNTNSGGNASTDLIVNDDQDSTHYGDLGINSSTYSQAGYSVQSPGDVYFYSNKSNVDIGTVNAAANGIDSIKFTCAGLNKSNLVEVMSPAGITTQVHFAPDSLVIPVHTVAYAPKYVGEKWIYAHAGDTTECTCISTTAGRKIDSVTKGTAIGWTSTVSGWAPGSVSQTCNYSLTDKTCSINVTISGNSNATNTTFTLPFIPKRSGVIVFGQYTDGGTTSNFGVVKYTAGSNVASCSNTLGGYNGWSGVGVKALTGLQISYEIQ